MSTFFLTPIACRLSIKYRAKIQKIYKDDKISGKRCYSVLKRLLKLENIICNIEYDWEIIPLKWPNAAWHASGYIKDCMNENEIVYQDTIIHRIICIL